MSATWRRGTAAHAARMAAVEALPLHPLMVVSHVRAVLPADYSATLTA